MAVATGIGGMSCGAGASQATVQVAAASSLRDALQPLAAAFTAETGVAVVISWGSSGQLARQLEHGAPHDVFASADGDYVDQLLARGVADGTSRTSYARGRLVLWSPDATRLPAELGDLGRSDIGRIGLANPEHAPYGRAARDALTALGVWAQVESKLVYGSNVRQAMQFADTGNVDASLVAWSLAVHAGGGHRMVPARLHRPLEQVAVVTRASRAPAEARAFVDFLRSPQARAILAGYGYDAALAAPTTTTTSAGPPHDENLAMAWQPLLLSFKVALAATLLSMLIGVAIATLLARRPFFGRELVDALVTTPLVLPPTVLGYYLLVSLGQNSPIGRWYLDVTGSPIVFTVTGAIIAATIGALPLVVKSARAALEAIDPTLIGAARTLGASRARAFFTVSIPLAAPGIVAGVMLAFARSLGDFGITLMVAGNIPDRTQTAALYVYDAIQAGREAQAAGMIAVLTAAAIAILYTVNKLTRGTRTW